MFSPTRVLNTSQWQLKNVQGIWGVRLPAPGSTQLQSLMAAYQAKVSAKVDAAVNELSRALEMKGSEYEVTPLSTHTPPPFSNSLYISTNMNPSFSKWLPPPPGGTDWRTMQLRPDDGDWKIGNANAREAVSATSTGNVQNCSQDRTREIWSDGFNLCSQSARQIPDHGINYW